MNALIEIVIAVLCVYGLIDLAQPYAAGENRLLKAVLVGIGILIVLKSAVAAVLIVLLALLIGHGRAGRS